ncbi:hypothetical protein [Streptomyces sp. NPDC051677]|uniref:hypothetical protein n=1 Tax=Streptomyces sp. NPDC051677 TaxID=3365669 RepID=UPI0037D24F6D
MDTDRQGAGRAFESFLFSLFELFDMQPRLGFGLEFPQIDGSITFGTDDYILEAKWLKGAVEAGPLMLFNDKVRRKGKNALGLFISVNGFSSGAASAFNEGTAFLTVDGTDVLYVLDDRVRLDELPCAEGACKRHRRLLLPRASDARRLGHRPTALRSRRAPAGFGHCFVVPRKSRRREGGARGQEATMIACALLVLAELVPSVGALLLARAGMGGCHAVGDLLPLQGQTLAAPEPVRLPYAVEVCGALVLRFRLAGSS